MIGKDGNKKAYAEHVRIRGILGIYISRKTYTRKRKQLTDR
jgi:hypothetical protein